MKEWRILKTDLPDSIFFRVYQTRFDLLRAVIVGAPGTPYHDGLFFFDIVFPTDYPNQPPKVYYHSHGLLINPNLDESGQVCLSLINTWGGGKCDSWNPDKSTILRLLVCIRGLVLNDKPFFNDPDIEEGNIRSRLGREGLMKKSIAYSEDVFIQSCQTMLYNLQSPPRNFESFVTQHFRARAKFILAATKAYSKGSCTVGQYLGDGSSSSSPFQASENFMSNAAKMYSNLDKAFKNIVTSAPVIENSTPSQRDAEQIEYMRARAQSIVVIPEKRGAWEKIISLFKCM